MTLETIPTTIVRKTMRMIDSFFVVDLRLFTESFSFEEEKEKERKVF